MPLFRRPDGTLIQNESPVRRMIPYLMLGRNESALYHEQFIDLTKRRMSTFFEDGIAGHVPFADPVCPILAAATYEAASATGARAHKGGTYVCIEGPQFSTRAESLVYRSWGVSVIGMANMPEAKLAREAELPYATLALSTDYDCWHCSEEAVTVEMVVATLTQNAKTAQQVLANAVERLPIARDCECARALATAIMTRPDVIPAATRERLDVIVGKYLTGR